MGIMGIAAQGFWAQQERLWAQQERLFWGQEQRSLVPSSAPGTGIMDHLLPMPTHRLHMLTLPRPMGMGILIMDLDTPATTDMAIMDLDTPATMAEGAMRIVVMDIRGK
jgi:hypothetical protein